MLEWLLKPFKKPAVDDRFASTVSDSAESSTPDTTSSNAQANAQRELKRQREEQLKEYLREKKKQDPDGELSKDEEQSATDEFERKNAEKLRSERLMTGKELDTEINKSEIKIISDLETALRLLPVKDRLEGYTVKIVDGIPVYAPDTTLPEGKVHGDILFWNATAKSWNVLERPSISNKVLNSDATTGLKWGPVKAL